MKRHSSMSIAELVAEFERIAVLQYEAILDLNAASYNRLYDMMGSVRSELKIRPGDARTALIELHRHPNSQVRLKAAISTLSIARDASVATLQGIVDNNEEPQRADAVSILRSLAAGRFVPS